jgi:hypothetical protein
MEEEKSIPVVDPKVADITRKIDMHCTEVIEKHAKFEGQITPGKLKLAGIVIINQPSTKRVWVEQDGKMVGTPFYWGTIIL